MAILLKTLSVRVSSIQIMQFRVQNKGKSVWKSRYDGDVSKLRIEHPAVSRYVMRSFDTSPSYQGPMRVGGAPTP